MSKLTSGRYVLTLCGAICFILIVATTCSLLIIKRGDIKFSDITPVLNAIILVISNVFTFYFVKRNLEKDESVDELKKD